MVKLEKVYMEWDKLSKLTENSGLSSVEASLIIITENSASNVKISELMFSSNLKTDCQSL